MVHFHVDRDLRISEANNSELQTQQCHCTKFPFEISEILLAESSVSKRRGRGRGRGRGLLLLKKCCFKG